MAANSRSKVTAGAGSRRKRGTGRAVLLAEAVRLFAARGYDGVTVDEIVGAAAVNKRMVYHYFGSKEGIYRAALADVFEDLRGVEETLIAAGVGHRDPVAGMRGLVRRYFEFLETHPAFVRLLLWENLSEGAHLARIERRMSKSPILAHVSELLRAGTKSGHFRAGLDARLVLTSLIGLCLIYFSNRHTLAKSVGIDFAKASNRRRVIRHASDMFVTGLCQ